MRSRRGAAALVALAIACNKSAPSPEPAPAGTRAAAARVSVEFAFDSLDDHPVSAQTTRGKTTVLSFITTSNLAAQAQVDFLVVMAKHDADRINYVVVALEPGGNRELVELYRKALSIPFPVAMADAQTLTGAGAFGAVNAIPVTVILDRSGRVAWRVDGRVAKSDELRAAMRNLSP